MKVSNGYQLYPDGEIFAKVPKWEYGFNRFRFLASYCATAVFKFDEATYGELAKNLVIEIGCKINAMRYGFYDLSYPGGYGIFVFDWRLKNGYSLSLRGDEKGDYTVIVSPKKGGTFKETVLSLGALCDMESVVYADAASPYFRLISEFERADLRGEILRTVIPEADLNAGSFSEGKMLAKLLNLQDITKVEVIRLVTKNRFLENYQSLRSVPIFMRDAIEKAIALPGGRTRTLRTVSEQGVRRCEKLCV